MDTELILPFVSCGAHIGCAIVLIGGSSFGLARERPVHGVHGKGGPGPDRTVGGTGVICPPAAAMSELDGCRQRLDHNGRWGRILS